MSMTTYDKFLLVIFYGKQS